MKTSKTLKVVIGLILAQIGVLATLILAKLLPRLHHWIHGRITTEGTPWLMISLLTVTILVMAAALAVTLLSVFKDEKKEGEEVTSQGSQPKKKDEKKPEDKKDDKKPLSPGAQFLRILGIFVLFAVGLWPLLLMAWLWTKIPSKALKGLALIAALAVMAMQGYYGLRIRHPEIDNYVGSKLTQVTKEAQRTGTKPETTWWMKSIDAPTKLKPVATEHPAHQLTVVEWDRNSVIHFRYKWTTNTGKEKQVDYRWDIAHEPDYGKWTIWEGGKPTQHARWRMEWNEGQGCWIGSEEDTDGAWHSFTIYPRK